jgi:hypothetical protein
MDFRVANMRVTPCCAQTRTQSAGAIPPSVCLAPHMASLTRIWSKLIVIPKKFCAKRFECFFGMFVRLLS